MMGPPRGAVPNLYSSDLCFLAAMISILAAVSGHMVEKLNLNVTNVPLSPTAIGILYMPIYGRQRSTDSLSHSRSRTTGKRLRIAGMIPDTVTCRDNAKDT